MQLTKWLQENNKRRSAYLAACEQSLAAWQAHNTEQTPHTRDAMFTAIRHTDAMYLRWCELDKVESDERQQRDKRLTLARKVTR